MSEEPFHEKLFTYKRERRSEINTRNVLVHNVVGVWYTDTAVSHTTKSVMFFVVIKSAVPLVVLDTHNKVFVH